MTVLGSSPKIRWERAWAFRSTEDGDEGTSALNLPEAQAKSHRSSETSCSTAKYFSPTEVRCDSCRPISHQSSLLSPWVSLHYLLLLPQPHSPLFPAEDSQPQGPAKSCFCEALLPLPCPVLLLPFSPACASVPCCSHIYAWVLVHCSHSSQPHRTFLISVLPPPFPDTCDRPWWTGCKSLKKNQPVPRSL